MGLTARHGNGCGRRCLLGPQAVGQAAPGGLGAQAVRRLAAIRRLSV